MRLELQVHHIRGVAFGRRTEARDGTLYVNAQELEQALLEDQRLARVGVELASPGDDCRIVKVADVVEPRCKLDPPGADFPGALSPIAAVGHGITRVLRGAAVVTTTQMPSSRENFPLPLGGVRVLDMTGAASQLTDYANTFNVVLSPVPASGVSLAEYEMALKYAGWRASVYLAQRCGGVAPDQVEVFDLPPLPDIHKGMEGLPRIAYIYQIWSHQSPSKPGDAILYGDNVRWLLPTVVHPNEVIDGAVLNGSHARMAGETYSIQNHPVVFDLLRRHGVDVCFVGVVLTVSPDGPVERARNATMAATMARWVLGADGAVLTKLGGGAPQADLALLAEKCEQLGMKSVLIISETSVDGSADAAITIATPAADAIVSAGSGDEYVLLPRVARVIGGQVPTPVGGPPGGENRVKINTIVGATSQIGANRLVGVEY
ncbi:MAG: hypothetical protein HYY02_00335 [Chloroflexi bacterium]|nr:hypothetical protein [Chloroflexota bacterium]